MSFKGELQIKRELINSDLWIFVLEILLLAAACSPERTEYIEDNDEE